jgi:hypothetical protein
MELTDTQLEKITPLLNGLLPGTDAWPSAGSLGLAEEVVRLAALDSQQPAVVTEFLDSLPPDFAELDTAVRHQALVGMEQSEPDSFGLMVRLAYNAYYTNAEVLQVLRARTGYEGRAPQPDGYELPEFDESILDTVRRREPLWRSV